MYWTEIVISTYFLIVQIYQHNLPEKEKKLHIEEEFRCFLQHCIFINHNQIFGDACRDKGKSLKH